MASASISLVGGGLMVSAGVMREVAVKFIVLVGIVMQHHTSRLRVDDDLFDSRNRQTRSVSSVPAIRDCPLPRGSSCGRGREPDAQSAVWRWSSSISDQNSGQSTRRNRHPARASADAGHCGHKLNSSCPWHGKPKVRNGGIPAARSRYAGHHNSGLRQPNAACWRPASHRHPRPLPRRRCH